MKLYQLTYLLSPDLNQNELQDLTTKIQSLLQEQEGILIETRTNQETDLGYEIKKKKKAFWGGVKFQIASNKIQDFQRELKKLSQILRFMITSYAPAKQPKSTAKRIARKPFKEKKVELEKIEERLSELLGE